MRREAPAVHIATLGVAWILMAKSIHEKLKRFQHEIWQSMTTMRVETETTIKSMLFIRFRQPKTNSNECEMRQNALQRREQIASQMYRVEGHRASLEPRLGAKNLVPAKPLGCCFSSTWYIALGTCSPTATTATKTTTNKGNYRNEWWQKLPVFILPVIITPRSKKNLKVHTTGSSSSIFALWAELLVTKQR